MDNQEVEFRYYNGQQIIDEEHELFQQMRSVCDTRPYMDPNIIIYLNEESTVWCMFQNNECVGFSWLAFADEEPLAKLCWFVTDKDKLSGLDAKFLLDETFDYCKSQGVEAVKFNCFDGSCGRIRNKEKLFEKFGYKVSQDESYDMSIEM